MALKKVKLTGKQPKLTKTEKALEDAEFKVMILEDTINGTYSDIDEIFTVIRYVLDDLEAPEYNVYKVRKGLQAAITLLLSCQRTMMECADLDY